MNRATRRKKSKQEKKETDKKIKAMRWVSSLPPAKAELIKSYANIIAKRDNEIFIEALERCYSAAIIEQFEEVEFKKVEKVIETFSELLKDDGIKMAKIKEEFKGDIEMATKKINSEAPTVEERAREIIKQGLNQKKSIETLVEEFPKLSKSMLTNAYKKVKTMIKNEEKAEDISNNIKSVLGNPDIETKEALDYIFGDENEEDTSSDKIENEDEEFEILKEVRILDVKGKYATYHIEKAIVEVGKELQFTNEAEVKDWASREKEEIEKAIAELKAKLNEISYRESEILKVMDKFI